MAPQASAPGQSRTSSNAPSGAQILAPARVGPQASAGSLLGPTPSPAPLVSGVLVTGTAGVPISITALNHPDVGGFLIHQGWKDIEPAKGVFDWSYVDGEFLSAVAHGKKTKPALHIGGDDAPRWLYEDLSIPFVLGKSGVETSLVGQLSFSGSQLTVPIGTLPGDLPSGKMIEISGTPGNDGRYRVVSDTTGSITIEGQFSSANNVSGLVRTDVVPCYWHPSVIQHKADAYNAVISHVQTLGQPALDAMLNISISMVGPNTGDWSFPSSAAHIASYNAAGWATGNNAEKQAGLSNFTSAMLTLYGLVLPNVPPGMLAGSAVGPVPFALLPNGVDNDQPASDILNIVETQFPGKLIIGKGALNANTYLQNPCPAVGSTWERICDMPNRNFLQINWATTSPGIYKANGNHPWDHSDPLATATILRNAALSAYSYQARWFEIWHAEVDGQVVLSNPALQSEMDLALQDIKDLFLNGPGVVGAPVLIQSPPAIIVAPVGTEFILQYVFDYNGEVPTSVEVRKDGLVIGSGLSHKIQSPSVSDSGFYEVLCSNSAGTTSFATTITFL